MSYTSNGANRLENFEFCELEQGAYPQESANSVTPAMTVLLTTPQSGDGNLGLGTEVLQSSCRNYQQDRWTKLPTAHCR